MSIVEEFLELRKKWSHAFEEDDEEAFEDYIQKGKELKKKFTEEDWKELISKTNNKQAKKMYEMQMKKLDK